MPGTFLRRDLFRGAAAFSALSYSRILGANERLRLGLIGCGDRGLYDLGNFQQNNVDVVALCDVYGAQIEKGKKRAPNAQAFSDHRKMLELKDLDVALIATPDHWHAACAIDALNAGKDVFIEKPLTLTVEEGPKIVKAARDNKRICQVGMQQRSGKHYIQAKREYFDTGKLGKITLVRTWWHGNGYHLRKAPAYLTPKPQNLDWNHFLGQVKYREYDPQQYFNWRAYLDYGGGQVTDLFTHWIDVVHMFMGSDIPTSAVAAGGVYEYKDGRTAPDTINVLLEYPAGFSVTFEATLVPSVTGIGIEFCGTKGRLFIDRAKYEARLLGSAPVTVKGDPGMDMEHVNNFLACVKSRELPNGDVLVGHRSAQASHLGNIAYVQKRRIEFDTKSERIL